MDENVVLIEFYEATPSGVQDVSRRMTFLGKALSEKACNVTWIKSNFSHIKKQYFSGDIKSLNDHFRIIHVPGIGYKRNVCIRRCLHDLFCAKQMLSILKSLDRCDIIVCSNQNIIAPFLACRFANKRNIPFVFDLRDPWPDAFPYTIANNLLRSLIKLVIIPTQFILKQVLKKATAIVSMSSDMLNWGLRKIPHKRKLTKVFYLSTSKDVTLTQQQVVIFSQKYEHLIARKTFKCFYISRWGINFHPLLLVDFARQMQHELVDFILCGDGDYGNRVRKQASSLSNVFLPGFLSHEEAYFLAKHCHCGIVFRSNESKDQFEKVTPTFPNKAFFNFMCGLPLLNGMPGELSIIVEQYSLGFNFHENDFKKLRQLILLLKDNEELRVTMGKKSRSFFEQYGNPEKVYTKYARFVKGLCR